ncbi:MAG: efflux transporter outer membrane subunit, partial [Rubrivivax sp.]|nr:efflux transporter outer membrane subunit [Rubrivivax sp.]
MSRRHFTLLALGAALALGACGSLVPATQAPSADLRAGFRVDAGDPPLSNANIAHEWDGFFADERLRRVVGLALTGNRSLRAGLAAVERARAQYGVTEAARWPDLRGSASASRQGGGASTNSSSSYSVSLGLASWEIDLFDRLGSLEGAALARYLVQQETQSGARLSLVASVAEAWLNLAAERQREQLALALRDSQQRTLGLTERQYALGAVSGLQMARAQTAFEAARGEVARTAAAVVQARLALELLAGQPLPESLLPTAQVQQATALPDVPAGLPATVLLQRPDLRSAEQTLQAAAYDVGAARAARFPRITLTANAGTRSAALGDLFRPGTGFWSLLPSIDLPIFDAGARQSQVDANEATRRQALAQYESALQSAFREVADALAVRDSLAERLLAQQAQVDAAERSLSLSEQSYRLGALS